MILSAKRQSSVLWMLLRAGLRCSTGYSHCLSSKPDIAKGANLLWRRGKPRESHKDTESERERERERQGMARPKTTSRRYSLSWILARCRPRRNGRLRQQRFTGFQNSASQPSWEISEKRASSKLEEGCPAALRLQWGFQCFSSRKRFQARAESKLGEFLYGFSKSNHAATLLVPGFGRQRIGDA